jgi:Ca2+-binding RTX toxin-like protein
VKVILPLGMATGFASVSRIQDVTGSQGNDLIVGDANPNVIVGGTGRNILIGGAGSDTLTGSVNQDNILIGGTTLWDTNLPDLMLLMHEWLRTDLNFDQRMSDLSSGGVGIANSVLTGTGVKLDNTTVFADSSIDTLNEPSTNITGRYWFFVDADDLVPFSKHGKTGDHTTTV